MKTFIFNEILNNWVEEETNLLLHDLALFLDEENKIIYLWQGPKSKKIKKESAFRSISNILDKYEDFELKILKEDIPIHINKRLMELLEKYGRKVKKGLKRTLYLKLYIIFSLIGTILSLSFFVNLLSSLSWIQTNGNFQIDAEIYSTWILISQIFIIISLLFFIGNQILSFIINRLILIIITAIGVIMSIGFLLYISQGIFLFLFQSGWTNTTYLISKNDLGMFLLINLIGIIISVFPTIFSIFWIYKHPKAS